MTAWCKYCAHKEILSNGKKRADCSRQWKISSEDTEEDKERIRRYLWFWASRAQHMTRKKHQGLERHIPENLLSLDDIHEHIENTYDPDGEAA